MLKRLVEKGRSLICTKETAEWMPVLISNRKEFQRVCACLPEGLSPLHCTEWTTVRNGRPLHKMKKG